MTILILTTRNPTQTWYAKLYCSYNQRSELLSVPAGFIMAQYNAMRTRFLSTSLSVPPCHTSAWSPGGLLRLVAHDSPRLPSYQPSNTNEMASLSAQLLWPESPNWVSLAWLGEGNGTPLQYSCLENPRDWGAWWAAIYGVAQSQTRLKRLSSSSSSSMLGMCLALNRQVSVWSEEISN